MLAMAAALRFSIIVCLSLCMLRSSARLVQDRKKFLSRAAPELDDFGLSDSVWDGLEPASQEEAVALSKNESFDVHESANGSNVNASDQPRYVIAGQYNTGTNLLEKLIQLNFPAATCHNIGLPRKFHFWKHVKPAKMKPPLKQSLGAKPVVALVIVRDPLSWLQSMRKAPYDLIDCTRTFDWLSSPCASAATQDQDPVHLPGLPAFWNEWTRDYVHMTDFSFVGAAVIRYEDLVFDTEGQLQRVGELFQLPRAKHFNQQHGPAKDHGSSSGRAAAIHKIQTKSYLEYYRPDEVKTACTRLDRHILQQFAYDDCLST